METLTLTEKLATAQSEIKAKKSKFNSFGSYNYRSCEDILEAAKPVLLKYGLVLFLSDEVQLLGNRFYVKATARLTDGKESVEVSALAREAEVKKGMDESQITGTASSYARKYALNGLFCLDDAKDADTDEYTRLAQAQTNEQIREVWNANPQLHQDPRFLEAGRVAKANIEAMKQQARV